MGHVRESTRTTAVPGTPGPRCAAISRTASSRTWVGARHRVSAKFFMAQFAHGPASCRAEGHSSLVRSYRRRTRAYQCDAIRGSNCAQQFPWRRVRPLARSEEEAPDTRPDSTDDPATDEQQIPADLVPRRRRTVGRFDCRGGDMTRREQTQVLPRPDSNIWARRDLRFCRSRLGESTSRSPSQQH